MNSNPLRSRALALAVCALISVPGFAAQKRRSVAKPTTGTPGIVTINGTVLDDTTGAPVASVRVESGDLFTNTTAQGAFKFANVPTNGSLSLSVERTGYQPKTVTVSGAGTQNVTIRLTPTPTVTVRLTNGTTLQLDREELKFGYTILFVGFAGFEHEDFCLPDGSQVNYTTAQIKRVIGPATTVTQANCCAQPVQKVRLELKSGTSSDVFFTDSCKGETMDLAGRNHVTGQITFIKFTDIAEVIFP